MTKPGRINCCVPFCGRTASRAKFPDCEEIICGKCWRRVASATKATKRRVEHRHARIGRALSRWSAKRAGTPAENDKFDRLHRMSLTACGRAWERCKAEAIEAAGGTG